mgnify:FL=1
MKYFWGCKHKKEMTPYSDDFDTRLDAMRWYRDFGERLERIFNRELIFIEKQ